MLFSRALDRKDEGREAGEVLDMILAENAARCRPALPEAEVEGIVKSAMRYPVRSGKPSPEVVEAVKRLDDDWWERTWKGRGGGGQTDRDVKRVLIELAWRYGRLREDGSVEVSASVRSVALAAATTFVTISRGATKRLAESGQVLKVDNGRGPKQAATWVLLPPAEPVNTRHLSPSGRPELCVNKLRSKRVWELETPCWRRSGYVGKGAAGVLNHLEARGGALDEEALSELLSLRPRDLHSRGYVGRLVAQGLVEDHGGAYALPGDYLQRVEEVREKPYSTVRRRLVRRYSPEEGRFVASVIETGAEASEEQRYGSDLEAYQKQRELFDERLKLAGPKGDEGCRELLNTWDDERSAALPLPEGADGWIEDLERVEEDHPPGCECLPCFYESLTLAEGVA